MTTVKNISTLAPVQQVRCKPSKRNSSDLRFCLHDQCNIKLSIYNLSDYCVCHERQHSSSSDFI
jgi:hypothetical protein